MSEELQAETSSSTDNVWLNPGESPYEREWAEFEGWQRLKRRNMTLGVSLCLIGLGGYYLRDALVQFKELSADIAWASWATSIIGGIFVCDSKGRTRWWTLASLLVILLLPDRNRMIAPNKPSTGSKPEGSVFSDW